MKLADFSYPIALAIISILVAVLEHFFPWRKEQRQLRPGLFSDILFLVFNGHFLGVILYGIASHRILPGLDRLLGTYGLTPLVYRNAAMRWPLWVQIPAVLLIMDFVQWCVHNLLHRVPILWELHKTHHSVRDGEMDFIVSFRFQWTEVVVYKAVQYLPLAFFGFSGQAVLVQAVFGTLIGHLNHSNLDLGHGPWKYVLNSPRMHIWHHNYDADGRTTVNFGIVFSLWDFIFGTAHLPPEPPRRLGFSDQDQFPRSYFAQQGWPLPRLLPAAARRGVLPGILGLMVLGLLWLAHLPPQPTTKTPLRGEPLAASQPLEAEPPPDSYARSEAEASAALSQFGAEARAAGYAHPEYLVSISELAHALHARQLVVLDIRPQERFAAGHIPSALPIGRADYSLDHPIPGLTRPLPHLEALLRTRGVRKDSVIVLYTDGGPEAFRFFWSLQAVTTLPLRILDGGLPAWKQAGHAVAGGAARRVVPGDVVLEAAAVAPALRWQEVEVLLREPTAILLDSRTSAEYRGEKQHPEAVRSGHIPGARHFDWQAVFRSESDPRLRPVAELRALFQPLALAQRSHIVTACQSGTRSAALYFALLQLGIARDRLSNYNGSWAEYSRLGLPLKLGAEP